MGVLTLAKTVKKHITSKKSVSKKQDEKGKTTIRQKPDQPKK